MKLNVKAFALAGSLFWGTGLCFIAWWIMLFEGATGERTLIGQLYPGYNISPLGSVIGLVWGAFDGLIGGAVLAWLYNLFVDRMK
ncbi:MAG: bacteriophage holin [Nitrospirae bacterium]|nr:bacteriophage holin [Nitrospirota bacterium]